MKHAIIRRDVQSYNAIIRRGSVCRVTARDPKFGTVDLEDKDGMPFWMFESEVHLTDAFHRTWREFIELAVIIAVCLAVFVAAIYVVNPQPFP